MAKFKFYARPNQSLRQHIINMLKESKNNIERNKFLFKDYKNTFEEYCHLIVEILIISHDIGKLSPYFQKRMKKEKIPKNKKKYSYHTQTSAIFGYLLCRIIFEFEYKVSNKQLLLYQEFLSVACYYIILEHHSKYLDNLNYEIADDSERIDKEDVIIILSEISNNYSNNEIFNYFKDIVDDLTSINIIHFKETFQKFLNLNIEQLDDILFDISNFTIEMLSKKSDFSNEYFFITEFYSLLCDLDEWDAIFHIKDTNKHFCKFESNNEHKIDNPSLIDNYKNLKIHNKEWDLEKIDNSILKLRNTLYSVSNTNLEKNLTNDLINGKKIFIINAPTGSGKTLTYLNLALKLKNHYAKTEGFFRKIIYSLPFISIIDQVGEQLKDILQIENNKQSDLLTLHHHLADIDWIQLSKDENSDFTSPKTKIFLIEQWHSTIIVTTFIKLLESILKSKKRNLVRFNKIAGSIIILDEMQAIPPKYWEIIAKTIDIITKHLNCIVLIGTATMPFLPFNTDINVLFDNRNLEKIKLNRYEVQINQKKIKLSELIVLIENIITKDNFKDLMIVMNTRKSAKLIVDHLINNFNDRFQINFLSTFLTPNDRKYQLNELIKSLDKRKKGIDNKPIILVCTQVIEAGVDVSFSQVIRDFAPLDSIIQVCGRCNRNNEYRKKGTIKVYNIIDDQTNKAYTGIYDGILLETTKKILMKEKKLGVHTWQEKELRFIAEKYFKEINSKKITSVAMKSLKNLRFTEVNKKFVLIEDRKEKFILIENDLNEDISDFIRDLETEIIPEVSKIPKYFYKHGISLASSYIKKIEYALKPIQRRGKIYFYYLPEEAQLYSTRTGFHINKI